MLVAAPARLLGMSTVQCTKLVPPTILAILHQQRVMVRLAMVSHAPAMVMVSSLLVESCEQQQCYRVVLGVFSFYMICRNKLM